MTAAEMYGLVRFAALLLIFAFAGVYCDSCQQNHIVAYVRIGELTLSTEDSDEVIDMNPPLPLTPTCRLSCDKSQNCTGFSIDYRRNKCIIYKRDIKTENLVKHRESSIFNKTCLSPETQLPQVCRRKGWQADLWFGWTLKDDEQTNTNVSTLEDCTIACLTNSSCGSATFRNGSCTFHQKSSRRSLRNIQAAKNSILVDNWCHAESLSSCSFSAWSGLILLNSDISLTLSSAKKCEETCNSSEDIPCWTYTYNETSQICSLSSDNNMVIPDESSDSVYGERECTSHGRWTRSGICTCDINTGAGQKENLFGRLATFVHSVGKAVYDAVDPGHAPETACQCVEKPIQGEGSEGERPSTGEGEAGGEVHAGGEGKPEGEAGGEGKPEGEAGNAEGHGETGEAEGRPEGEAEARPEGGESAGEGAGKTNLPIQEGVAAGPVIVNYPPNGGIIPPSNGLPFQNTLYGGYQNQPQVPGYDPYIYNGVGNPYYTPQGRDRRHFSQIYRFK